MTKLAGLSSSDAEARLKKFGFNEIEEARLAGAMHNAIAILSDPMGLMLLVLAAVYWSLGKHTDAVILLIAYIPIVGVDVLLELKSQKALRALKKSIKSTCHVIRDGETRSIPTRHLVPGDLLILEEGQTLPADGRFLEVFNVTIDEASVTGESVPVEKTIRDQGLSGTTVLTGSGTMEVENTGLTSQIGTIAQVLKNFEATPSPLLRTVRRAVKLTFLIAIGLASLVFAEGIYRGSGYASSLISSLTLGMAAIPEEFPLVFTLYLSLAAFRLSKKHILVKSLPAVEGLGRVDVICSDKTGTITEGKFKLDRVVSQHGEVALSEAEADALIFACEPKAVDAMEAAIFEWVKAHHGERGGELHSAWDLQFDYPFDTAEKYMSHVWKNRVTGEQVIAMKGALEGVLNHCDDAIDKAAILSAAKSEAGSGKRLLGLAMRARALEGVRTRDESGLQFIGILSFTDPVRPGVAEAIHSCVARGIRVKMLTGDHLLTAHAVADKIGLPHEHDQLFSGADLEKLPANDRKWAYIKGAIFARLKPEQKLELVQALKEDGEVVAMTGDGINDAPALKLADVGISMGDKATDVARSTAQLVLLKNDFKGIVDAVLEGERVLLSLSQSFGYLIAFHIPIIGVALFQSFLLPIPILQPIHIVLLELIVHPVSAFVFNNEGVPVVRRKAFVTKAQAMWSAVRGGLLTALAISLAVWGPETADRNDSLGVMALVLGNIGLLIGEKGGVRAALTSRSRWWTLAAAAGLMLLAVTLAYVPPVSHVFSVLKPSFGEFLAVTLASIALGAIGRE